MTQLPYQQQQPVSGYPGTGLPPVPGYAPAAPAPPGYAPAAPAPPGYAPAAPAAAAGMFSGVGEASVSMNNEYMKAGRYYVKITAAKVGQTRKYEDFSAIEGDVVAVFDNDFSRGHRVGESVTDFTKRSSNFFLSDAKSFVAAASGVDPSQVQEQQVNDVYGPLQPLTAAGIVMEVEGKSMTTQAGHPFTKILWKRAVPAAELLIGLDQARRDRFFPNNILVHLAQVDAQQGGAPAPAPEQWGSALFPEPPHVAPAAPPPVAAPAPPGYAPAPGDPPPPAAPALGYPAPALGYAAPVAAPAPPPQQQYRPAPAPPPQQQQQYRPAPVPAPMPPPVAVAPAAPPAAPPFLPPQPAV